MSEKTKRPRLMVLNEPDGRRFSKALAMEIGRDHAEVFLQVEYLISISSTPLIDGEMWTRQAIANLQEEHFPYWGKTFIAKIMTDLVTGYEHTRYTFSGYGRKRKRQAQIVKIPALLKQGNHNQWGMDVTHWYALAPEGIRSLQSVMLDEQAVAVSVSRKRVHRRTETSFRKNDNPFPEYSEPVPASSATFITETPTETPAVVVPEFSPEPPRADIDPPAAAATFFGEGKELEITHPILATRTRSVENRATVAERVYMLVRPGHLSIPAKDKAGKSHAESVLLAYFDRYGSAEQAAIALRAYAQAWDEKYKQSSKTNLTWLTSWAAAESLPQNTKTATNPAVVISDAMYCEVGKPLFNATLDEASPDFSKHYRAWMSHQADCEQCQGKKKSTPVSTAPRSNPLKSTMRSIAEGKSI